MATLPVKWLAAPLILLTLLVLFIPMARAAPRTQEAPPALFTEAEVQPAAVAEIEVMRRRLVHVDLDLLAGVTDAAGANPSTITLNLFADTTFVATLDQIEPLATGGYAWIGHIPDQALSQVVFVVMDGITAASIILPGAMYRIHAVENGLHAIDQISSAALPRDAHLDAPEPEVDALVEAASPNTTADDGSTIDLLVVYTSDARAAAGGAAAIQALINQSVVQTNSAFANSQVTPRLRLVHTAEVSYTEAGFETDLDRLRRTSDGYLDQVHALRDQYGADLVTLLVRSNTYCGIAYITMRSDLAFSVVYYNCAAQLALAHELGHNLGAYHDWFIDTQLGTAPGGLSDNHGWINYAGNWRTIMAYGDYCYRQIPAQYCNPIAYFSNADLVYNNSPLGLRAGSDTSCKAGDLSRPPNCDANNARVFNANAYAVANYRQAKGTAPTATPINTPTRTPVPPATSTPTPTRPPTTTPTRTPTPTPITGNGTIRINFQPVGAPLPAGHLMDSGAIFGNRGNGYSYGWNAYNSFNTRDRNASNSPDQRYDTLIYMQRSGTYTWEIALPNATYRVRIVSGDPSYYDSIYKLNAEGVLVVNGTASRTRRWVEGTTTVTVRDGRLSITNAVGSFNNKMAFVEITRVAAQAAEVSDSAVDTQAEDFQFSATLKERGITLAWRGDDTNAAEFRLYRGSMTESGEMAAMTPMISAAAAADQRFYTLHDETATEAKLYGYWLDVVWRDGTVTTLGPVVEGRQDPAHGLFLPVVAR